MNDLDIISYKKASLWTVVVGRHDLENANESCHQVRVCFLFTCECGYREPKHYDINIICFI